MSTYRVFKRTATNFEQFASARKTTIARGLTMDEARRRCASENAELTQRERAAGTRYEFESVS